MESLESGTGWLLYLIADNKNRYLTTFNLKIDIANLFKNESREGRKKNCANLTTKTNYFQPQISFHCHPSCDCSCIVLSASSSIECANTTHIGKMEKNFMQFFKGACGNFLHNCFVDCSFCSSIFNCAKMLEGLQVSCWENLRDIKCE